MARHKYLYHVCTCNTIQCNYFSYIYNHMTCPQCARIVVQGSWCKDRTMTVVMCNDSIIWTINVQLCKLSYVIKSFQILWFFILFWLFLSSCRWQYPNMWSFLNWCWMIANWKLKPITTLTTCRPFYWLGLVENFCKELENKSSLSLNNK